MDKLNKIKNMSNLEEPNKLWFAYSELNMEHDKKNWILTHLIVNLTKINAAKLKEVPKLTCMRNYFNEFYGT